MISFFVIAETKHWLAVEKQSGLVTERSRYDEVSMEELVYDYLRRGRRDPYVGVVHRLDRVTSGVMIFAKKRRILKQLNQLFADRQIEKTYLARVCGIPTSSSDTLQHYLQKIQAEKRAILHDQPHPEAKPVRLRYELVAAAGDQALLRIYPATGKYHQIRVQLAAIGHPILGDEKYGASSYFRRRMIALHAESLRFEDPNERKTVLLQASPPQWADMKAAPSKE